MKTLRLLIAIVVVGAIPLGLFTGCPTPPDERVAVVQTLKAVGATAESAVATSAQLFRDGKISAAQATRVNELYDQKFQPAFRTAVAAAHSDLSKLASPDLINLATQLATLVTQFQTPTTPAK